MTSEISSPVDDLRMLDKRPWLPRLGSLISALRVVAPWLFPIAVIAGVLCGLAQLLHLRDPEHTALLAQYSIDHHIVAEQIKRSHKLHAPDLLLIGDSSCLMGVDAKLMSRDLGLDVQSLCSIGYVGPAGYADMLRRMIDNRALPKALIIMMHPVQFLRDPSWDVWVDFVKSDGRVPIPATPSWLAGLNHLRADIIELALYKPLPGAYGRYYGSTAGFVTDLRSSYGSLIDPGGERNAWFRRRQRSAPNAAVPNYQTLYNVSENFESALAHLRTALDAAGQVPIYLIVSPIPDTEYHLQPGDDKRARASRRIAEQLGIAYDNILSGKEFLAPALFASHTHLNRDGRRVFTESLIEELRRLSASLR